VKSFNQVKQGINYFLCYYVKELSIMNTAKMTKTTTLAILAIAAVGIIVSSTAIAKPALAKSNNGNSVSKSDIRDVGKFLQCISNHGGNDISKKQAQRCVDNYLG
jgi:hypothetical protein